MSTNPYTLNNSADFFLNDYLNQYKVEFRKVINGAEVQLPSSSGIAEGRLTSILISEATEIDVEPDRAFGPVTEQVVTFTFDDALISDRDDLSSLINNLIADQNISYHQSNYNLPLTDNLDVLDTNELFAGSHSFYQFRLRSYETLQEGITHETRLPSFINAVYYDSFPNYDKAQYLYTFGNSMDISSRFITRIPGVNPTNKIFNNHLFKVKNGNAGLASHFALEGNYFYDYSTVGPYVNDMLAPQSIPNSGPEEVSTSLQTVFMMFNYAASLNDKVYELPYYNHIELSYPPTTFTTNNEVKEAFVGDNNAQLRMSEVLVSMLKNHPTVDSIPFVANGAAVSIQAIDFYDALVDFESAADIEKEDEIFLFNPADSDLDENIPDFLFRKLFLIGSINQIMINQRLEFSDLFPNANQSEQYKEFIAYKILKEKFVNGTFQTVQTFYVYSYDNVRSFIDTQVNLDVLYRYNISAMFLICGHEASFKDIRTCDTDESDFWYDGDEETLETAPSNSRFSAKGTVVIKPSWKIVEIPVYFKDMRIMEPPPIEPKVSFRNVSNEDYKIKIVIEDPFEVNIFDNDRKIMLALNEEEEIYRNKLLQYTYTPSMYSTFTASDSVFDVYRLEEKPKSMQDFSDALYHTTQSPDVDEFGDGDVMSSMFDYLEHQKKYYYIVRTRTHRDNLSNPSPIYVVEKFKDADETILKVEVMTIDEEIKDPMETKFRRFMQINIDEKHLFVNGDTYQNAQSAIFNASNILLGIEDPDYESIWSYGGENSNNDNKYIKLRLESKRSGKKVDLNFYFKVQTPQGGV